MGSDPREAEGAERLPTGGTLLSVFALTHVSHSILAFQIDISEDDIDDGFRRLFVQLAGEVRVPKISGVHSG